MKKHSLILLAGIAGMLMIFSSCKKQLDAPNQSDELMGTPLPSPTTYCRIESIWENPGTTEQQFFLISYDEFENPKFMSAPRPGVFTLPTSVYRTFKYDQWHRLKEYILDYGNGGAEEWHNYTYDQNGRIGIDENYIWASSRDNPADYFDLYVLFYRYDTQGRISRVESHRVTHGGGSDTTNYIYNAAGNLIRAGVTYDNKVSMLRTNDIWMFLERDYSLNNPFTADTYNSSGYPVGINAPTSILFLPNYPFLHSPDLAHSQIGYGCRPSFYH